MNIIFTAPIGTSGLSAKIYALIWSTTDLNQVWSAATGVMESFSASHLANYVVSLVEVSTTGIYQFQFPASLRNIGESYDVIICERSANGALPTTADAKIACETHTFTAGKTTNIQITTA